MNRMKVFVVLGMLGIGCWLTALSAAADDQKEDGGDREFFKKASAASMAEVNLCELAVRFAHSPAVKQFAQRMIIDHRKANRHITQLANQHSIALARGMDEKHQKMHEKLQKLSGEEFDRTFMEGMVKDHEEVVKLFEKESKEGKNEAMKALATRLTPILKQHLEMAREVCKQTEGEDKEDKEAIKKIKK